MKENELKNSEKSKNKNTSKNRSNLISNHQLLTSDHNAITLIALVITIIVMLILVGVTVTVALNGGLFSQAKDAVRKTQTAVDDEHNLADGGVNINGVWYDSAEDYTNEIPSEKGNWKLSEDGITVTNGEVVLQIGDYVKYNPDKEVYSSETLGYNYTGFYNTTELTTEDLKWRILGVDANGCLTLISDRPTNSGLRF